MVFWSYRMNFVGTQNDFELGMANELLRFDFTYFEQIVDIIYLKELQLNKTYTSYIEASCLYLHLSQHDKTYNKTCAISKDLDQPVHPPSMARALVYSSLDSLEAVEGTCDQRRLWSDCADAQADLSLRWSHKSHCRFCRALAHFSISRCNNNIPTKLYDKLDDFEFLQCKFSIFGWRCPSCYILWYIYFTILFILLGHLVKSATFLIEIKF